MPLPSLPLPTDVVEVGGQTVEVRALSRIEGVVLHGPAFRGKPDDAEVYIVSKGTGSSTDDARAWLEETSGDDAGVVIDRILELSGLLVPVAVTTHRTALIQAARAADANDVEGAKTWKAIADQLRELSGPALTKDGKDADPQSGGSAPSSKVSSTPSRSS
jgi:hypothetical protein